jgi:hypothetical protein
MTMTARFMDGGSRRHISVTTTYGPISISVQEDPQHLRVFYKELGRLLEEAEGHHTAAMAEYATTQQEG